jgi:monoamine oxidase
VLSQPLSERVWFAGEAVHESLWGTVAGAWETGERAANEVINRMTPEPPTAKKAAGPFS